jgi:hypothetical protein
MSKRAYNVSDIFYSSWRALSPWKQASVFAMQQHALQLDHATPEYGAALIRVMRAIRKRWWLADKLNEEQLVDCYNDLKFLNEPWFYFPKFKINLIAVPPDEQMATSAFDQFIYADNEYSSYVATHDIKYLHRLVATLYRYPGEELFDKESVAERAAAIAGKLKEWELMLVFFTFTHIRSCISKRCPKLLPSPKKIAVPAGEEEPEPEPVTNTGPMWNSIKHEAASTLVFGSFQECGRANMYDVLDHLEHLIRKK